MVLEFISKILLLFFLGVAAVLDFRKRELPLIYIGAGFVTGAILHLVIGEPSALELLLGCLVGAIFLLIARISREAIGYGDGLMIIATGAFLGLIDNVLLMLCAVTLAALFSIGLLIMKKWKRKDEIPFIPFLLGGYVVLLAVF